jgi:hypothetical protein
MNKRLLKRHKRQVLRAKGRTRLSEPDVRTPEQVRAAREASRPAVDRRGGAHARYSAPPTQGHAETADTAPQSAPECSESTTPDPGGAADCDSQGAGRSQSRFERGKEIL